MDIIIVRHALAMEREEFAEKFNKDDSLRPLVPKGRKRMLTIATRIKTLVPKADLLVTSPYLRARQTADILLQKYSKVRVEEVAELVPSAPPEAFVNWLHTLSSKIQTLIVVGHDPHLGLFASHCLSGDHESFIDLKKSGAMCLEIDSLNHLGPRTAQLKWLVTPKILESR